MISKDEATLCIRIFNGILMEYEQGHARCYIGDIIDNSIFQEIKKLMTDLDLFGYSPENLNKIDKYSKDPYKFEFIDFDPETGKFMGHA